MSGIGRHLKSHVSKATGASGMSAKGYPWYIHTPQKDHMWAPDWATAMQIANHHAREAQMEALR